MNKANVMKALERCANAANCSDCPYHGMNNCDGHLCEDALALLKAEEKANEKPTYHTAFIYTKRDNLIKYFWGKPALSKGKTALSNREYYAKEREVQLILLVRYEEGKCICRIKCPINPLPIKGEFEPVNAAAVHRLLVSLGWTFKEKINLYMFQ